MKKSKKIVLKCCIALGVLVVLLTGVWRISVGLFISTLNNSPEKLLKYEENANGTLTLTGIKWQWIENLALESDCYEIAIPEKIDGKTVTEIGYMAFVEREKLKGIELPDSITTIGDNAFACCYALEKIELPDGVTTIGDSAFAFCDTLEKIKFPDGITAIGKQAFYDCDNLGRIEFPDNKITIGDYAFENCKNLVTVELPRSVSCIGQGVFRGTGNIRGVLRIPEGTTSIDKMFVNVRFSNIGDDIYSERLLEIWIPNTVTMIDEKFLGQHGVCWQRHRCVFYAEKGSYAANWLKEHEEEITKDFIPDEAYKEAIVIY